MHKRPLQKVSIGYLANGQRGLFTNGMLAFPLAKAETIEQTRALCARLKFELVE